MPIIINEFEIIPAPPPKAEMAPAEPAEPTPPLMPEDLERVEARFRQRLARIFAD
jgi:hypothetical protein